MLDKLRNIFQIPELRRRLGWTALMFAVYRLGEHVPTPGVNAKALAGAFESQKGTLFGLYDLFVGGAFSRATIFALGIMPYISSSIIIQLLGAVVPYFEKLRKEGEEGQKKLTQLTRYGTVLISIIQSLGYAVFLQNPGHFNGHVVVPQPGLWFAFSTILTQATGKIPVQYAKRIVGRRMFGGASTHIPLRVNTAGVIPIIFASSLMILPATVLQFAGPNSPFATLGEWLKPVGWVYNLFYAVIIIFFTYFYTAVVLNPNDLAENMRKYGGFVPGIRPGRKTAEYIDRVLTRITLPGAVFLSVVAVVPNALIGKLGMPSLTFGGTSVLIVVGVALDTLQQIESHLLMRHYEGFVKRGRIRGRTRM